MEHNMVKKLVGGKPVNIYKRGQGFELGNTENKSSYNPIKLFGKIVQLNSSPI